MATIVVHPEKEQLKAVKAFLKALNVPFEEKKEEKLPNYVIEGFRDSQKDFAEGRFTKYTGINDLFTK